MANAHSIAHELVIVPFIRDLGEGFQVRRVLPSAQRRMVGPFIFFDQMGPAYFTAGQGINVRPHPHINLATVTYLFEGEIVHRDSLGSMQPIRPGAVNWMTAGRGVVHSERTSPELKATGSHLFGIQTWLALPLAHEEAEASFTHYAENDLPMLDAEGKRVRVMVGHAWGLHSPVRTFSEMIYADVTLNPGAALPIETIHEERAIYVVSGAAEMDGSRFQSGVTERSRPSRSRAATAPLISLACPAGSYGARSLAVSAEHRSTSWRHTDPRSNREPGR